MMNAMSRFKLLIACLLALSLTVASQDKNAKTPPSSQTKAAQPDSDNSPAEDFSGMYSFLKEGEFVQITLDKDGITGYISRMDDQNSDQGAFLDQWFSQASVKGHDMAFTTKALHGVWFEFKGAFARGPAKTKAQDGYYVLRGTLTEFVSDADKKVTSHAREVEFKLLAEPEEKE
jgi:hypothetical protein